MSNVYTYGRKRPSNDNSAERSKSASIRQVITVYCHFADIVTRIANISSRILHLVFENKMEFVFLLSAAYIFHYNKPLT